MTKKVAFFTLGCKLNFSETSTIARQFTDRNFKRVDAKEKADVYVINTCSVTGQADKKCRQIIKKAIQQNPEAFIAVTGCYAQLKPLEIANIQGVDVILGTNDKFKLFDNISKWEKYKKPEIYSCNITDVAKFEYSYSAGDRTRSFLKIQDGCNYHCAYCTIPLARGKSRNNSIAETLNEAKQIADSGIKEIILTGVNIGDFGRSTNEKLIDLLKELDDKIPIPRIRISSVEPNLLSDDLINFVASSKKILPHFHIPLQSGCDKTLAQMGRRYNTLLFKNKIETINRKMPDAFIGIDVIVGFPGEKDDDFNQTYQFLEQLDYSFLHIFTYSDRPNTRSIKMQEKVHDFTIKQRSEKLHLLSEEKHRRFYQKNIGQVTTILLENEIENNQISGFSENYLRVAIAQNNENQINSLSKVKLEKLMTPTFFQGIKIE